MSTEVKLRKLPMCDFCREAGKEVQAEYDFRTSFGPWANGCEEHYKQHRFYTELGTGRGQKLVKSEA